MEELYSDLENYQDEYVITELRNENRELKCKLEEYASSLANLQKDFDKLTAEYKNLELNYSSLLKTARAEIERKSQLITNLNVEKDKLVINSLQNRGRFQYRKISGYGNKQQTGGPKETKTKDKGSKPQEHNAIAPNLNDRNVSVAFNQEGKNKYDNTTFSVGLHLGDDSDFKEKDQKSKIPDHNKNAKKYKNDNNKIEETHLDVINSTAVTSRGSRIRDRRKSMPLLNRGDCKFSSDEDYNDDPRDHRFKKKSPMKEVLDKTYEKSKGRKKEKEEARKLPVFTRVRDRNVSNYETIRDGYHKSSSWNRYNDRQKSRDNRDKYEFSQRSKRHNSPDRPHYNIQQEYKRYGEVNERVYRTNEVRNRVLVSPPPERYNQHRGSREYDSQRFQHESAYSMKHKRHDVTEEPACKRLRGESLNKQSDKHMTPQDRNFGSCETTISKPLEFSYHSLQSPDYVNLENCPAVHQIKEIMGTADIKLDDPRLTSKKYVVSTHKDKVVLSTVIGRDVDIKLVDTTIWNKDKDKKVPEMPTPLKERPGISEDFVKDINMCMENPISNLSLESGEICFEDDISTVTENKDIVTVNSTSSCNKLADNSRLHGYNQNQVNETESTDQTNNMQQSCSTLLSKNYRIPKMKKSNSPKLLEDDVSTCNKLNKNGNFDQCHKKKTITEKRDVLDKNNDKSEINDYNPLKKFSVSMEVSKNKMHDVVYMNNKKQSQENIKISAKDTVEGDLELSDETCDYIEVSDRVRYKETDSQKLGESNKNVVTDVINKNVNIKEPEKLGCISKHFNISHNHNNQAKETLSKIPKEDKTKDMKNKLCYLFGDTSSLITPDDLGILEATATKDNLNQYSPLFDNTQDAVDLNVEEMEKVQTRSLQSIRVEDASFIKEGQQDVISEKREKNKVQNSANKMGQKFNNKSEKSSSMQHKVIDNVNVQPADNTVVKTVIISTGVQNNCEHEKQLSAHQTNANDNKISCPTLRSIKALATSTPQKPQIQSSFSVLENSCNSITSVATENATNDSTKTDNVCKVTQKNLDVPDVRIIVKRRRKAKGVAS